jgi:hypothetical protein
MINFVRKERRAYVSPILKGKLSHVDNVNKSDPKNLILPNSIEKIKDNILHNTVEKILKKYKQKNYHLYSRETLEDDKNWNDFHILTLVLFYKRQWGIIIEEEEKYYPHFVFTYNLEPLKKEIDKIIEKIYNKIDINLSKEQLKEMYNYNALDVTYLLHYLSLKEQNQEA